MSVVTQASVTSKPVLWLGRVLSGLPVLFLLFDAVSKFFMPEPVITATLQLGFPESAIMSLGVILLCFVVIYMIPASSVLGAILLTAYLGGAVAVQMRLSAGAFSLAFPVLFALMLWAGLYVRNATLRKLIPFHHA